MLGLLVAWLEKLEKLECSDAAGDPPGDMGHVGCWFMLLVLSPRVVLNPPVKVCWPNCGLWPNCCWPNCCWPNVFRANMMGRGIANRIWVSDCSWCPVVYRCKCRSWRWLGTL